MPGPKSTPVPLHTLDSDERERRAKVKPNRKAANRLKARQAAFVAPSGKYSQGYHMPGSENRSK